MSDWQLDAEWDFRGEGRFGFREIAYWTGIVLVCLIYLGGTVSFGYAYNDMVRAVGWGLCAALAIWAAFFWASGRFVLERFPLVRWALLFGVGTVVWAGCQLVPLPVGLVRSLSPFWAEALEAMQQAGYAIPERLPLASTPEAAWTSWNQMVAAVLFLGGACVVASRRQGYIVLAALAVGFALVESWIGLAVYVLGNTPRAYGLVYNPNHHAAAIMMGLPVAAWWVMSRKVFNRYGYAETERTDIVLLMGGIVVVTFAGWAMALSRGALVAFIAVSLASLLVHGILALVQRNGNGERSRRSEAGVLTARPLIVFLLAVTAAVILYLSQAVEGLSARLDGTDDLSGRMEYWSATLEGLRRMPLLGIGLGGTELVINRFQVGRPTAVVAVWSHNDWVQVVAELGLLWTVAALTAVGCFARKLWQDWTSPTYKVGRRHRGFRRAVLVGLAITLVHAFFDFHLRTPLVGFQFLTLLALLLTGTKVFGTR
jgi:hypothetical protein